VHCSGSPKRADSMPTDTIGDDKIGENTGNIYTVPEANVYTDIFDDNDFQDLLQLEPTISKESRYSTAEGLKSIIDILTIPKEADISRKFFGCPAGIKQKLAECKDKCTKVSCHLIELKSFLSACKIGTIQTCSSDCNPQCQHGGTCNADLKCDCRLNGKEMLVELKFQQRHLHQFQKLSPLRNLYLNLKRSIPVKKRHMREI